MSSKVVMPPYCMKREEVLDDQSIDKMPRSGVSEYLQEGAIIGIGLGDIWDE